MRRLLALSVAALLVLAAPLGPADGAGSRSVALATPGTTLPVAFDAVVGHSVLFSTEQALVSTDTDSNLDVYAWNDGQLTLMTPSSPLDVFYDATARGGTMVVGTTRDAPAGALRIYRYTATSAQAVNDTAGAFDATYKAVAADGDHIAFQTAEDLPGGDSDNHAVDVYVAQFPSGGGPPTMVEMSTSTSQSVTFAGATPSLGTIFFETDQAVVPEDLNATTDVYAEGQAWGTPGRLLVTNGTGGPDHFLATSANGASVIYETSDNDAAGDTDGLQDIYYTEGFGRGLMSGGTTAGAVFTGASADAKTVVYSTSASAAVADTDTAVDVYSHELAANTNVLLSGGTANQDASPTYVSPDASFVVLSTLEPLLPADTDSSADVYRATAGGLTLVSGQGTASTFPVGALATGTVYFGEGLDVLANEGGVITSISPGTTAGDKSFEGASADGSLVAFSSPDRLLAADTDAIQDIYAFGTFTPAAPPPDTTAPTGSATSKKQKNDGTIEVTVACSESCTATPSGSWKKFKLSGGAVSITAGHPATVKVKVPKKAKKAAAALLKKHKKVKVSISVTLTDAAGNHSTVSASVQLKK